MDADRWKLITRIYGAVLARPPDERADAVVSLCGDDPELRQEIESLLDESDDHSIVLDRPPWDVGASLGMPGPHLTPGTVVGSYRIAGLLGVGGMGEVHRARDTRLNRDVAIKVLPAAFAGDPDRLARFRREAQVLASVNHPNIAGIYGLEEAQVEQEEQAASTSLFLVMELVEGDDLSHWIARGALPLDEALPIARQIAEALEAAHERGIVHRDLKPANIKVREDGTVKVLDFGLAKFTEAGSAGRPALTTSGVPPGNASPTIAAPGFPRRGSVGQHSGQSRDVTVAGMILGTAAYMSPEQAKGRPADKRSDIWAFGCVVFEMLTGRTPFSVDDVGEILTEVRNSEPDWGALSSDVPPPVAALLRGCLRRDRKERIGDIAAALFLLRESSALEAPASPQASTTPPRRRGMLVVVGVVVGLAIATAAFWRRDPYRLADVSRFAITLAAGRQLTLNNRQAVAVSPDGKSIVYMADDSLFLRALSDFEAKAIPGATLGQMPAFSPDGQSLVFYVQDELAIKRIGIGGGTAVTVCRITRSPTSLVWAGRNILFSDAGNAIMRVPSTGGEPEVLLDFGDSDDLVYGPQLLPDGDLLLFGLVKRASPALIRWGDAQVVVQSLRTGHRTVLVEGGTDPQYVSTGHIVYMVNGTLFAAPFELATLAVTGAAVPVVDGISVGAAGQLSHWANYAFSTDGSLIYVPGPRSPAQSLFFVNGAGVSEPLRLSPGKYEYPRASPDGKRIAFGTTAGNEVVVSVFEWGGGSLPRRITFGSNNRFPIWSEDSRQVAFQSDRDGDHAIFAQPADGSAAVRLTRPEPGAVDVPESWSPDGKVILYSSTKRERSSLFTLSLIDGKTALFSNVRDSALPADAVFSPNGRWVAYQTGKTLAEGTTYVEPFPPTGSINEIGRGGRPLWSRDGKRLFFVPTRDRFMAVSLMTEPIFTVSPPVAVARGFAIAGPTAPRTFDVMPDGRFLVVQAAGDADDEPPNAADQIRVVVNWFEELKRLVPTK